jgi:hypothetical protein
MGTPEKMQAPPFRKEEDEVRCTAGEWMGTVGNMGLMDLVVGGKGQKER